MKPAEVAAIARFAQLGLRLLSQQVLTYMAFLATCLMWGNAAMNAVGWTITAASVFTLLVFWPCLYAEAKKREDRHETVSE